MRITINAAIDYATDNGIRVSDDYMLKGTRLKAFNVASTFHCPVCQQVSPGSRRWSVEGLSGDFTRAEAIRAAVDHVVFLDSQPNEE